MTEFMNYYAARDHIKSGDMIMILRDGKGLMPLLHSAIEVFTGSPIYHTVVAVWMTSPSGIRRLMAVETNLSKGKRIVPLSYYANKKLEVFPLPNSKKFEDMEEEMMDRIASQPYSPIELFAIGIQEFFGFKTKDRKGQVCSELSASLWVKAGVDIPTHVSPGKLRNELVNAGIKPLMHINF